MESGTFQLCSLANKDSSLGSINLRRDSCPLPLPSEVLVGGCLLFTSSYLKNICCFIKCISDFWFPGAGRFWICFKKAHLHFTTCIWQSKIYKNTTYWGKENRTGIAKCCCWFGRCYSFIIEGLYSSLLSSSFIQITVNSSTFFLKPGWLQGHLEDGW